VSHGVAFPMNIDDEILKKCGTFSRRQRHSVICVCVCSISELVIKRQIKTLSLHFCALIHRL